MKQNKYNAENIAKRFDKELKQLLLNDLKAFKAYKGQFLRNKHGENQGNLLVA